MYYFDNAATTAQKPPEVALAVYNALRSGDLGNPSRGAHGYSLNAYRHVLEAKELIKALFHGEDDYEVAFTQHATEALNMTLKGLIHRGDHVLTTTWEHNAVLRPLYQMEDAGVALDFISSDPLTGALRYEEFARKLRPETTYVVCNHGSNVTGNVLDLTWIKQFCKDHSLGLIVDVSQTAGAMPIDISDGIVTALCFTGHKSLYGPAGTGGICIRRDADVTPWMTGGDGIHSFEREQPHTAPAVFEAGTANVAGIMGLAASVQLLLDGGLEKAAAHRRQLEELFVPAVQSLPGVTLYGDFTGLRVGTYSLNIEDAESAVVGDMLWERFGMATRAGFHCAPLMHKALHTDVQGAVRFSFSLFTSARDVQEAVEALRALDGMM